MEKDMEYKCKRCGEQFAIDEHTKVCPHCNLPISIENDIGGAMKRAQVRKVQTEADLKQLVTNYENSGDPKELKTVLSAWDTYTDLPDFNRVWRSFIILSAGAAVSRKDGELQAVLKNHARDFDSRRTGSDLFLSLLKTHPKLGTTSDWEELIKRTHGDQTQFAVICDSIIHCIHQEKDKAFAIEIFNIFYSKKDAWADAGRTYIRALLSSDRIASEVFPTPAFRGTTRKFAANLKSYCKHHLGGHGMPLEETKVWKNFLDAEKARKKRNTLIVSCVSGLLIAAALSVLLFLNAIRTDSIAFSVEKVIEVTYGDEPKDFLKDFHVSYQKNSGAVVTEPITDKMVGYDPEKLGEQTVYFEFKGVRASVTIIVKKLQLETPKLTQYGNYVQWEAVPHAQYYAVYVNATSVETQTTTSLSYNLSTNANHGNLKVTVRAFTEDDKYEPSAPSDPLWVDKLEAPQNLVYTDGRLIWNRVDGATVYELTVNGTPYTVSTPECQVDFVQGENTITIIARDASEQTVHGVATQTIFYGKLDAITGMSYADDKVSWQASANATSFAVYVDGIYWKDFSRNYFSIEGDGFADAFGSGIHEIGIVCKTATMGIEPSNQNSYHVAIGNHITMVDGTLSWSDIGLGATYFISVNGTTYTTDTAYLSAQQCDWKVGDNTVTLQARVDGTEYVCETVTVVKQAPPSLSVSDSGWSADSNSNNRYSIDGGTWSTGLPNIDTLSPGAHTIRAKRIVASSQLLELESEEITLKLMRAEAPSIQVAGGVLQCAYDTSRYALKIFYATSGSSNWTAATSVDEIVQGGQYQMKASLVPLASAFPEFDAMLASSHSAAITVTKLPCPSVIYNPDTHILTSDQPGARFYYLDEAGTEHEIIGGDTQNMPNGVFLIYARLNATEDGVLSSAITPAYKQVSVFNVNIDFHVNALQNQNVCNLTFEGCNDINELSFTYKIEYFDANGTLVGSMDRTSEPPITITTKAADGAILWTQLTYFHPQFSSCSYQDFRTFKITVFIDFGNETLVREASTYK